MKKFLTIVLAIILVFTVAGCIRIVVPGETKASSGAEETTKQEETTKPEETSKPEESTEPETKEEPSSTEEETLPEEADSDLQPGLFKGTYSNKTYNLTGPSYVNLQSDGRFYRVTYWSDGGGSSSAMGNYVVHDGKVSCYVWFVQAGDPSATAQPDAVEEYEIVDAHTLKLIADGAEGTYQSVTDQAEVESFAQVSSIVWKLANYELYNEYGTKPVASNDPAKVTAVYRYDKADGTLWSVTLVLFENGRYSLAAAYSDGSVLNMVGNFLQVGDEFWLTAWFSGGVDSTVTLCNGPADYYRITETGNLVTAAFQESTGGSETVLTKSVLSDSELAQMASMYDVAVVLKYCKLYGN